MKLLQRTDLGDRSRIEEYEGHLMGNRVSKFVAIQIGPDGRLLGTRDYVAVDHTDAEAKIKQWRGE